MSICKHCDKNIPANKMANHVRWKHTTVNPNKYNIKCSCVVCKKELHTSGIKRHHATHLTKKIVKSHCNQCNAPIYNNNKFCNSSCAAIYNNSRNDYSKIKTGPKPGSKPKYTKIKQCVICNKFHPGRGASCSKECKSKLLSICVKERIYNGWNPNDNRGRGKQSYLESSFESWLNDNYPILQYQTEYPIKRLDVIKTYFADFYFPSLNLIIELDGTQHKYTVEYDTERDDYISSAYGIKVVRISHKEYTKQTRINEIKNLLRA